MIDTAISGIKQRLVFDIDSPNIVPWAIKHQVVEELGEINKRIKGAARSNLK